MGMLDLLHQRVVLDLRIVYGLGLGEYQAMDNVSR
jgi:hypothetical protein